MPGEDTAADPAANAAANTAANTAAVSMAQKQPISPEMAAFYNSLTIRSTPCNYCEIEGVGYHVSGSGPERDQILADFEKNAEGSMSDQDFAAKWAHARVQD